VYLGGLLVIALVLLLQWLRRRATPVLSA